MTQKITHRRIKLTLTTKLKNKTCFVLRIIYCYKVTKLVGIIQMFSNWNIFLKMILPVTAKWTNQNITKSNNKFLFEMNLELSGLAWVPGWGWSKPSGGIWGDLRRKCLVKQCILHRLFLLIVYRYNHIRCGLIDCWFQSHRKPQKPLGLNIPGRIIRVFKWF